MAHQYYSHYKYTKSSLNTSTRLFGGAGPAISDQFYYFVIIIADRAGFYGKNGSSTCFFGWTSRNQTLFRLNADAKTSDSFSVSRFRDSM